MSSSGRSWAAAVSFLARGRRPYTFRTLSSGRAHHLPTKPRWTAATLETVAHTFLEGSPAVCVELATRIFQGLALSRTKPRKSPALHTHQQGASTPSLPPFNMIFSFRCARGVYHVGRERRSARRQARGHFFPETPGRSASRHPGQPIDCSLIFVRHRALYRKKWVRRTWLPSGG